ncbi:MAG: hypothetical protein LBS15_02625 [Endomicrobium sp.]|nr:hypothetical protein [Endomicrobium sp.]
MCVIWVCYSQKQFKIASVVVCNCSWVGEYKDVKDVKVLKLLKRIVYVLFSECSIFLVIKQFIGTSSSRLKTMLNEMKSDHV